MQNKTDIIFSFDTEDFTCREAADGIRDEAEILRSEGVRGCFCLVGLLARQLVSWGRSDVLEALRHHEIESHTYGHTLHPMINEYTDIEDYNAAHDEVVRQESEAIELIRAATGVKRAYAAVPPGNQKSYAAMYAYADMGIPIYADTFADPQNGRGAYYCNIYNIEYMMAFEELCFTAGEAELRAALERLAGRRRAVVYTHPHVALYQTHWDILNYDKYNHCEFGQWVLSPRRTPAETARFYANMRRLVQLIKADERFNIRTYSDVASALAARPKRSLTRADMPKLRKELGSFFGPTDGERSYSVSDVFLACVSLLRGEKEHVCGKTYGFLDEPRGTAESCELTAEELVRSAENMDVSGFLPTSIEVGQRRVGPADWLFAAMDILCGAEKAAVAPREQLANLDILPHVRDAAFKGTWRHSDEFADSFLSDRLRRQIWTLRF